MGYGHGWFCRVVIASFAIEKRVEVHTQWPYLVTKLLL
jgi:hypothetical protein